MVDKCLQYIALFHFNFYLVPGRAGAGEITSTGVRSPNNSGASSLVPGGIQLGRDCSGATS